MFEDRELPAPEHAGPEAFEVLRIWAGEDGPQDFMLRPYWEDPGSWGLLFVDIAHHVANAYAEDGLDRDAVLDRIKELFDAEWDAPTGEAEQMGD